MSVKIRLRRMGTINRAFFRVVAVNSTEGSAGKYLENLGYYNPRHPEGEAIVKLERVEYWKGVGAQVSTAVKALLKANTDEAIAHGLFGVPTFSVDGKLFWGLDALPMLRDAMTGGTWFEGPAWAREGQPRQGVRRR